jgi:ubiquinone/menaquinone biosynthesis C-methylase UbiE
MSTSDTYSTYAEICSRFYDLTLDSRAVGDFVVAKARASAGNRVLFVGGMFQVAAQLQSKGLELTAVDNTDEMVAVGTKQLSSSRVLKADLRSLPFDNEFDIVFVVGRVFTHMTTDEDLTQALASCRRALTNSGKLFADNYQDTRIQITNYFNGRISVGDERSKIVRDSTTERMSESPCVVTWRAEYSGELEGSPFRFSDSIEHRAFSREEFSRYLSTAGFRVEEQGDNFDETSFYSLATKLAYS